MNAEKRNEGGPGSASERPNFIFILADDLGYADLGCYGGREYTSPNLDKMAPDGAIFSRGYANSSVCSPSRFAIITGRYQHRLRGGFDEPIASAREELGLPPEHPTMPSMLRDAGYATALIGKWHMGYLPWFGPLKSGYQEFFGHRSGAVDFFKHESFAGGHDLWDGDEEAFVEGYTTDIFADRAVDFHPAVGEKAVLAVAPFQRSTLAVGNPRRQGRVGPHRQHRSSGRRLRTYLSGNDPPDGRGDRTSARGG